MLVKLVSVFTVLYCPTVNNLIRYHNVVYFTIVYLVYHIKGYHNEVYSTILGLYDEMVEAYTWNYVWRG